MIVCFGDSITYGQGLDDPSREAFPALLAAELGEPVVSRGVCSDTTRSALERFPRDVQESGARLAVIQFGHNDCNEWASDRGAPRVSVAAFTANLREMAARAERFGIGVIFLAPHPTLKGPTYERRREAYVQAMRESCPEPVIQAIRWRDGDLLLDLIHLNEHGHGRIAAALADHIREST